MDPSTGYTDFLYLQPHNLNKAEVSHMELQETPLYLLEN